MKTSRASILTALLPLALCFGALSGCGLHPVYADGSHGVVAKSIGHVEVEAIEGKGGWLVRNALNDRFEAISRNTHGGPSYRLVVVLDDRIVGSGVLLDDTITREQRSLRARYQLIDTKSGAQVMDRTAGSDVGIDVSSSEYSTIAAEDSALDRLAQTIADQIIAQLSQRAFTQNK
jgi:LPS-assembly lipoprotein